MEKKIKQKKFTWGDMKKMVNKIPPHILKQEVVAWPLDDDEESGKIISGIEVLKEDNVHDGDNATSPKSVLKEAIGKEEFEEGEKDGEYYLIFPKGMRIIIYK